MQTKKGAGGKPQAYDSKGRYAKMDISEKLCHTATAENQKRANVLNNIYAKVDSKNDPLVKSVILYLEENVPHSVKKANEIFFDNVNNKHREFDIMTSKTIIEVKSGTARHCLKQFIEQNNYAKSKNMNYVVFAPNIKNGVKKEYTKNNIKVITDLNTLKKFIKENGK